MLYAIVAASGLLVVFLSLALAREVRLRRALQNLLARIFRLWRDTNANDCTSRPANKNHGPVDTSRRDRL